MNIEGAKLPSNNTVGPDVGASFGKMSVGSGNEFANAFNDQIKRSKTAPVQAEISQPAELQYKQPQNDVQPGLSDDEALTALLGNRPLSADKIDKETEREPALGEDSPDTTSQQNASGGVAPNDLLFLTDTVKPATLGEVSTDTANQQNVSGIALSNGLPFAKPTTEAPNQGAPVADISLDDILPNKTFFSGPATGTQEMALETPDSAEAAEKPAQADQPSMPELENAPSGTTQLQQAIDSRTGLPTIAKPINHPGWSKDLGEHVVWLCNKAIPSAEITLNPEHLGPITVRIDVDQDQASIQFTTPHAAVKEVLEASIPKLREMLNSQQLNLVDVNVSQHSASNQQQPSHQGVANPFGQRGQNAEDAIEVIEQTENGQAVAVKGLLSLYA
ncbi:MAG: flagellar hook-length control protein FliK [Methylovulum sp.]|nr:flagellar hook-length control protein FliK [Methylovulum sp.]